MLLRRSWRLFQMVLHMLGAFWVLWRSGGYRDPLSPEVRTAMQGWYRGLLRILEVKVELVGSIPHERDGAMILIANHISWVDIPVIGSLTPVNFVSKAEIAQWPLVGPLSQKIGTVFISRGSGDTEQVMQAMAGHLGNNLSVLFFPEGTTTDGSKVRRFHKKLFKVCEQVEVNVCPLLIRYQSVAEPNPVPFVGDIGFGTHLWSLLRHRRIRATVEVLPWVSLRPEEVGPQMREVELLMRDRLTGSVSTDCPAGTR